jgi:hypothetical protein
MNEAKNGQAQGSSRKRYMYKLSVWVDNSPWFKLLDEMYRYLVNEVTGYDLYTLVRSLRRRHEDKSERIAFVYQAVVKSFGELGFKPGGELDPVYETFVIAPQGRQSKEFNKAFRKAVAHVEKVTHTYNLHGAWGLIMRSGVRQRWWAKVTIRGTEYYFTREL